MEIADRTREEVADLTRMANDWPIEVLSSLHCTGGDDIASIVGRLCEGQNGPLGTRIHDNKELEQLNIFESIV